MRSGLIRYMNDVYALDLVVQHNRYDIFSIIEPYITYRDPSTHAALISAVGNRHHNLVQLLIPYMSDESILAVFCQTCTAGNYAVVNPLISHILTRLWRVACSANLESAVTSARIDLVRVLISGGADLDTMMLSELDETENRTCVHWMAIYGLWRHEIHRSVASIVRILCEAGANVNAVDYQGHSALHHFAITGSRTVTPSLVFPDDFTNERLDLIYECALLVIIILTHSTLRWRGRNGS